jgi:hypothetical protein
MDRCASSHDCLICFAWFKAHMHGPFPPPSLPQASAAAAVASGTDPAAFSMGSLFSKEDDMDSSRGYNSSSKAQQAAAAAMSAAVASATKVALKVCVGPKRPRQMFVFKVSETTSSAVLEVWPDSPLISLFVHS